MRRGFPGRGGGEADRLYATFLGTEKDEKINYAVDADYSVTKDSVRYGVVTGIESEGTGDEAARQSLELTQFLDHPFSLRYRVDGNVLTVKSVNLGTESARNGRKPDDEALLLLGRWKKKTDDAGRDSKKATR